MPFAGGNTVLLTRFVERAVSLGWTRGEARLRHEIHRPPLMCLLAGSIVGLAPS